MSNKFEEKWEKINKSNSAADEKSLFVPPGQEPVTQRQLNLFYYFLFIKNIIGDNGGKKILEVGCGRGTMSLFLAKYLNSFVSLQDVSESAIKIAKKEFFKYNLNADFYLCDVLNNGIKSNLFDLVVSIGLAEHFDFDGVKRLYEEQFRLLKPGGTMISLNIPKKFSIQFLNSVMRSFKKVFGKYKEKVQADYFRNNLSQDYYFKAAQKAGFKEIEIVNVCPFPIYTPIKMSTDKRITKFNKWILKIRRLYKKYPYEVNYLLSQSHFLVGWKK